MKNALSRFAALLVLTAICVAMCSGFALAETYVLTTGACNVRTGAGLDYKSVGVAAKGVQLTYKGNTATDSRGVVWYNVEYDGSSRWVSSMYAVTKGTTHTIVATKGSTNLRSQPSLDGEIYATMKKGESATYLDLTKVDERDVAWYKVKLNGKIGWVSSKYTAIDGKSSTPSQKVIADAGDTNLRSQPSLDGKIYATMKKGESATYLNQSKLDERGVKWYKVSLNGNTGWVSSKYTKLK